MNLISESRRGLLRLHIAIKCARLHVPDPRSEYDAMIAATALVHSMTVVTRITADFRASGVTLINPWISQLNEEPVPYGG